MTIKIGMERSRVFVFGLSILWALDSFAQPDDDFLLDTLPGIIGATQWTRPVLAPIRELAGRWVFQPNDSSPASYFDFDETSSVLLGSATSNLQRIFGESSLSKDFDLEWCDGNFLASYNSLRQDYRIICDWGFPTEDIGTVFIFSDIDDEFEYREFFYSPAENTFRFDLPSKTGQASRLPPLER